MPRKSQRVPRATPSSDVERGDGYELRFGRWQSSLADVTADVLISDPPYGRRTHASEVERNDGSDVAGSTPDYEPWTRDDVFAYVRDWSPRINGWMVNMTSDDLITDWRDAYADVGRQDFAPVTAKINGMTCRMRGDGPSSWTIYILVARPRTKTFASWGTLPGGYDGPRQSGSSGGRGKPSWLCNALVRDYSRRGDVIVDPMGGWATTLQAAVANQRTAVGAEMDRAAYDEAVRRLRNGVQVDLLAGVA